MARASTSFLPPEEEPEHPPVPWAALLRAQGMAPPNTAAPLVGNASPAEAPGQSAEAYAAAAQAERAKGNMDTAGRLTVQATEQRTQEQSAQGTPEPATPLAPAAVATPAGQPRPAKPPSEEGLEQKPFSFQTAESTRGDMESPALYQPLEEPPPYVPPSKTGSFFALALDALLNKGQNAGRIVGQLAQGDDQYTNYQRRVRAAKDAAQLEATRRRGVLSPEEQAYKDARLQIAREGLGLRKEQIEAQGDSLELRKEQSAIKNDPNHAIAERVRQNLYAQGVQPGSLDGLSLEAMKSGNNAALRNMVEQAQSTEMAAVAAEKAAATARATEGSKIRVAEGISDATQANKLELVREGASLKNEAEKEAADREAREPIPGMHVVDEVAATAALRDPVERRKLRDAAGAYSAMRSNLDRMIDLREKHGIEVLKSEARGEYETAHTLLIGALTQLAASGVLNGGEFERYKAMIPGMEPKASDLIPGRDLTAEQLAGARTAMTGGIQSKLRPYGVAFETPQDEARRRGQEARSAPRPSRPRAPAARKPTSNVVAADDLEF